MVRRRCWFLLKWSTLRAAPRQRCNVTVQLANSERHLQPNRARKLIAAPIHPKGCVHQDLTVPCRTRNCLMLPTSASWERPAAYPRRRRPRELRHPTARTLGMAVNVLLYTSRTNRIPVLNQARSQQCDLSPDSVAHPSLYLILRNIPFKDTETDKAKSATCRPSPSRKVDMAVHINKNAIY